MRFAFWSEEGSSLSWARRLHDEGADVLMYCAKPHAREGGAGIVRRAKSRSEWIAWGLQSRHTIYFFDCTNNGDLADRLRKQSCFVVGGGSFMDRLEMDRAFGQQFAQSHGILVPPTKEFGNVQQAVAFMRGTPEQKIGDGGWAWKPDKDLGASTTMVGSTERVCSFLERTILPNHGAGVSCIVQERIPGVALSTARWWNGTNWTGPFEGTIEEKKFMDGDVGPATGCALNSVWFYFESEPKIAKALKWEALAASFRAHQAPPGLYDINAVVNEQGAYFLEWTPRLGIDSELTSQRGITNLAEFLYRIAHSQDCDDLFKINTAYHGVRLTIPPYPCEDDVIANATAAIGVAVNDVDSLWKGDFVGVGVRYGKLGLETADPYGFVGCCVVSDTSVERGFERIAKAVKKFDITNVQYRTDGAKIVTTDIREMMKAGWGTNPYVEIGGAKAA